MKRADRLVIIANVEYTDRVRNTSFIIPTELKYNFPATNNCPNSHYTDCKGTVQLGK